jgi:predicted neutral ceramidase superfamily lipid hydrolase
MIETAVVGVAAASAASAAAAQTAAVAAAANVGFIAGLTSFAAGILFTLPALLIVLVLGILSEWGGHSGWAVFMTLVTGAISYAMFNVSLLTLAIGLVGYFAIGFVWSFYRYKRHATKVVEANQGETPRTRELALLRLHPKAMVSTIISWVLVWPFSLVENFIGDLLNGLKVMILKWFRGVYHGIYDSAVAALK